MLTEKQKQTLLDLLESGIPFLTDKEVEQARVS